MISESMVCLAQTVHQSDLKLTVFKRTKTSFHFSLITPKYHPVHPKQFLSLWYVWRKQCTYHALKLTLYPKGPNGDSTWPTSARSSIRSVDVPCTETNTISKWTETRVYMTHVTKEFYQVRPKWFLSLRYTRYKPCTYLESRLAQSPNELKRASIWASLPRTTIRFVQNDF
jgi:hypothetical protein